MRINQEDMIMNRIPSSNPPCGLEPKQVPQLISFTFDDNTYSGFPGSGAEGGIRFIIDQLHGHNAAGTFYVKGNNATENPFEDNELIKQAWKEAYDKGFEIGSHTYSHPHGIETDWDAVPMTRKKVLFKDDWKKEINQCLDVIKSLGIPRSDVIGHRTPFLAFNDDVYSALQEMGFEYEAAVEEGWQTEQDGTNFLWPYTLDNGCEGDKWVSENFFDGAEPLIGKHPGLWVLPCYACIVPPDDKCVEYGTTVGARERLHKQNPNFDVESGKVTGLDWNIWFEFYMTKEDALATLKYTFDLRYNGNRCPWPIGFHSDIYSDKYDINDLEGDDPANINANAQQRRECFAEFLEYVLSKPDTRVVTSAEMLRWLKDPSAL